MIPQCALLYAVLVLYIHTASADWLVKPLTFEDSGSLVYNGTEEYDKHINFALSRTYKDSDGEAADAMEHYFYGQMNGIAMELGGLDGSFKTGSQTVYFEKFNWKRIIVDGNPIHRRRMKKLTNAMIKMLREKSLPAAQKEFEELKAFAKEKGCEQMDLWDVPYWSERLREERYEFEEEQLRVFFPLDSVLTGMFALIERLFEVRIEAADGEQQVWHPDVRFFKIYESGAPSGSDPIAGFYLDPFSRPGDKRGGAWMDVCVGKSKVLKRIPVAYLTCNGSPPTDGKPSLMTFREVETLFHETGHGLQHMLTRVEHGDAAGINNVEWDAVELPSQFMENWCYDKPTLYGFAKHYETGEPLPDELFEKIKASKNFHAGMAMMRQLYFGMLDMTLHSTYDPSGDESPFDIQQQIAKDYTVLPPLQEDRFLCSFGHIFAGGYAAGYYSYKWAEVMSADAFAAFEEAGLDDEAAVKATGKRFRDTVLAMGGGKHPSKVYQLFRGKDASPEALIRHSGLTDSECKAKN